MFGRYARTAAEGESAPRATRSGLRLLQWMWRKKAIWHRRLATQRLPSLLDGLGHSAPTRCACFSSAETSGVAQRTWRRRTASASLDKLLVHVHGRVFPAGGGFLADIGEGEVVRRRLTRSVQSPRAHIREELGEQADLTRCRPSILRQTTTSLPSCRSF